MISNQQMILFILLQSVLTAIVLWNATEIAVGNIGGYLLKIFETTKYLGPRKKIQEKRKKLVTYLKCRVHQ